MLKVGSLSLSKGLSLRRLVSLPNHSDRKNREK